MQRPDPAYLAMLTENAQQYIRHLESEVERLREAIAPAKAILDQMKAEAAAEAKGKP